MINLRIEMVVMDKNKLIISYAPNFYRIVNFEYYEGDVFSEKLLKIYEKFIFIKEDLDEEDIIRIRKLDEALAKYIDDYNFRKEVKNGLLRVKLEKDENLLNNLINSIIGIFEKYEEGSTRRIYVSRFI